MKLHFFVVYLGTFIILLTLIVALYYIRTQKPKYFRYILTNVILGFLISINSILYDFFGNIGNKDLFYYIAHWLNFLQFLSLYKFFFTFFTNDNSIKTIKWLVVILSIIQLGFLLYSWVITDLFLYVRIIGLLLLIVFSVKYFRNLLGSKPTIILLKSSSFWIVTGVFFSFSVNLPIYSINPFLRNFSGFENIGFQLFSISNMTLIVFYILIIKGYLCLKYPQNP